MENEQRKPGIDPPPIWVMNPEDFEMAERLPKDLLIKILKLESNFYEEMHHSRLKLCKNIEKIIHKGI